MARRVLLTPYFDPRVVGGGTLNSLDLARAWLQQGHEVHVIKCDRPTVLGDLASYERRGKLVLHGVSRADRMHRANDFDPEVERRARGILEDLRPESVHVHNFHGLLGAARAAVDAGTPTIYTALGFGLACPDGYLYDGTLQPCDGPEPAACQGCLWRDDVAEPLRHRVARSLPRPVAWPVARSGLPEAALRLALAAPARLGKAALGDKTHARLKDQRAYIGELPRWAPEGFALLRRFDAVVVASPAMARVLVGAGVAQERIHFLPWGVLPDRSGLPMPPRASAAPTRLAFLGHAAEVKGLPFLARVLAGLPDGLGLEVVAFGSTGWLVERLPGRARRYLRAGSFPPGGLPSALRDTDATLVPSLWHENAPFAILETLACGRPAIVADREGMSFLVEHRRTGLVLPAGDVAAWRRALQEVAGDAGLLRAMAPRCAYDRTPERFASEMDDVIRATREASPPVEVGA